MPPRAIDIGIACRNQPGALASMARASEPMESAMLVRGFSFRTSIRKPVNGQRRLIREHGLANATGISARRLAMRIAPTPAAGAARCGGRTADLARKANADS